MMPSWNGCATGTARHPARWGEPERHAAAQLFDLLAKIGGADLVGPIKARARGHILAGDLASGRLARAHQLGHCRRGLPPRWCSCWPGRSRQSLAHSRLLPTVTRRAARDGATDHLRRAAMEPCDHAWPRRRRLRAVAAAGQRARHRHGALAAARPAAGQRGDGAAEPARARA